MVALFTIDAVPALAVLRRGSGAGSDDPGPGRPAAELVGQARREQNSSDLRRLWRSAIS
jgi:hypothetical protein